LHELLYCIEFSNVEALLHIGYTDRIKMQKKNNEQTKRETMYSITG